METPTSTGGKGTMKTSPATCHLVSPGPEDGDPSPVNRRGLWSVRTVRRRGLEGARPGQPTSRATTTFATSVPSGDSRVSVVSRPPLSPSLLSSRSHSVPRKSMSTLQEVHPRTVGRGLTRLTRLQHTSDVRGILLY